MYKLLVADDEQKDRNIVWLLVEKQYGDLFEILEAKSGTQALEILRNDQIDLLLLDMNMPGLSGMGVIRELKKPTYLIILTAYSFFDYAREALRYGVKDYILKPPIRSELYAAIDRFLQERKEQPGDNGLRQKALARELATQMLFYSNAQKIGNYCQLLGLEGARISLAVLLGGGGPSMRPSTCSLLRSSFWTGRVCGMPRCPSGTGSPSSSSGGRRRSRGGFRSSCRACRAALAGGWAFRRTSPPMGRSHRRSYGSATSIH